MRRRTGLNRVSPTKSGSSIVLAVAAAGAMSLGALPAHATVRLAPYDAADEVQPGFSLFEDSANAFDQTVPGEIAIDLKDDASAADIADIARSYGLTLRPNSAWSDANDKLEVADVNPSDEAGIIDRLSNDARVEHAERMAVLHAYFVPNDPLYASKQWHLKKAGAEQAWEYSCGRGVTVAVVDTGIACYDKGPFSKGSDLDGTRCGGGYNFVTNAAEAADDQGHGTHVAGTVAQATNNGKGVAGLAHCASLMPVKVLNKFGWGTLANVAEGIRFAADNGAQVINLSLGGPGKSGILEDAVNHALKKGVIVVAAAGNSGKSVGYPAAYDGVIAVSATDANDNIAWFSSRGPQIAIGAPGVAVTQQTICEGGRNKCELFGTFNGTSMASPHVAGAAALIVGMGISDPDAVRAELQKSAVHKEDAKLFGAGILDAGAAVAHAYWMHVALRVLAVFGLLFAVGRRIKKTGGSFTRTPGTILGALFGGVGLLPVAPLLRIPSQAGAFRWLAELLIHPFGEWDLVFDAGIHRWLPLASALPAMFVTALLFGAKRLRPTLGGFAIGSAALLAQLAYSADVAFPLGSLTMRIWTVANALVCLWIARLALDGKRA